MALWASHKSPPRHLCTPVATMATALQALLRRRAAALPSLALLPLSAGRHSTARSALLAAAAGGLPDVRRPQLSPAPVPPLLRYFSRKPSKGCVPPPSRRLPTSSKKTPRLEQGCTPPPRGQPPTSSEERPCLEETKGEEFQRLLEDLKNVKEQYDILDEALDNCNRATALSSGSWDDKNVAMLENGLEKAFKALAGCEKSLDDFSGALGSSNALSKDILQQIQMLHKEQIDGIKVLRQDLNHALFMALEIKKNVSGAGLSTSFILKKLNELSKLKGITVVASGMFFVLSVMIIVKLLA